MITLTAPLSHPRRVGAVKEYKGVCPSESFDVLRAGSVNNLIKEQGVATPCSPQRFFG
jgi:hypothetical protein